MLIKVRDTTAPDRIQTICDKISEAGDLAPHVDVGVRHTIIRVIGDVNGKFQILEQQLNAMPEVEGLNRISAKYKLAAKNDPDDKRIVDVGGDLRIGTGEQLLVVAGPCSIESEEQLRTIAEGVRESGAQILRGGAYKPRTGPGSFEGLGLDGLKMLRHISGELGMKSQSEVMSERKVGELNEHVDILQVGARNMQNFSLLDELGKIQKPVVLKRGPAATYEEWLLAAERILYGGNPNVILCERGTKGLDQSVTRNVTDGASIPVIRSKSNLPTMMDASHSVGKRDLIPDVALSGITLGADVQHLEVHHDPENALTDGPQSLNLQEFELLMKKMRIVHEVRKQCERLQLSS